MLTFVSIHSLCNSFDQTAQAVCVGASWLWVTWCHMIIIGNGLLNLQKTGPGFQTGFTATPKSSAGNEPPWPGFFWSQPWQISIGHFPTISIGHFPTLAWAIVKWTNATTLCNGCRGGISECIYPDNGKKHHKNTVEELFIVPLLIMGAKFQCT